MGKLIAIDEVTLDKNQWDTLVEYTDLINERQLIQRQIQSTPDKAQKVRFQHMLHQLNQLEEKAKEITKNARNLTVLSVIAYKHKTSI